MGSAQHLEGQVKIKLVHPRKLQKNKKWRKSEEVMVHQKNNENRKRRKNWTVIKVGHEYPGEGAINKYKIARPTSHEDTR